MLRLAIVCVFLVVPALVAQTPTDWRDDYNSARKLIDAKKHAQAIQLLQKSLAGAREELGPKDVSSAAIQHLLGRSYMAVGKPKDAVPVYKNAIAIWESQADGKELALADSLVGLARACEQLGDFKNEAQHFERALALREKKLGPDHKTTDATLIVLAGRYREEGLYDRATKLYRLRLARQEQIHGENSPKLVVAIDNLAGTLLDHNQFDEAIKLYRRNLRISELEQGADSQDVGEMLVLLGNALRRAKQLNGGAQVFARALQIYEAKTGADSVETSGVLNDYANFLDDMGRGDDAEKLYRRCLTIRESKLGKTHDETLVTQYNLAMLLGGSGRFADAKSLLETVVKAWRQKGDSPLKLANTLEVLGNLHHTTGEYNLAEPLYEECLTIREKQLNRNHPLVARAAHNLGLLHKSLARYEKAEKLLQLSFDINKYQFGAKSAAAGHAARELAYFYHAIGKEEKGREYVQLALNGLQSVASSNSTDAAGVLHDVGFLMLNYAEYTKAEEFLRQALKRKEKQFGPNHVETGSTLQYLAVAIERQGKNEEAVELYRKAKLAKEATLGTKHIATADSLPMLGSLFVKLAKTEEAANTFDEMRRIQHRHVTRVVAWLPEAEQLQYLRNRDEEAFHTALSLALEPTQSVAERSVEWVLNGKALGWQALAQQAVLAREARDPIVAKSIAELVKVRSRLAQFSHTNVGESILAEREKNFETLTKRDAELSASLAKLGSAATPSAWVELEAVRKHIPADTVLIDIVRIQVADFRAKPDETGWKPARYVAWIVPGVGDVSVIDLGPADTIEKAVAKVRKQFEQAPKSIRESGEPLAEKALNDAMKPLADLVFKPIHAKAAKATKWVVSPDASLWLVPWEAFSTGDNKYLVEDHTIRYVVSGRDVIPRTPVNLKLTAPLVFADPDYDLGLKEVEAETRALLPNVPGQRGRGLGVQLGKVLRLPGTATEAEAIAPRLKEYTRSEPQLRMGSQAVEGLLKASSSPSILVLCTHGYFLPDSASTHTSTLVPTKQAYPNPLLRCGLLFAGCNDQANAKDVTDDGVLTGLEAAAIDLRGTQIVVLSACETGLGEVRNGEGVAGLRQAFQLAGAECVVATLWQIPDLQSAQLMVGFFRNIASGQSRSEALQNTQRDQIKARRDRFGAAHPYYWAAYTLTGIAN